MVNTVGIGVLWLVVQLPYPVIYRLGCGLGKLALRFMKRRAKIVHRNLELCFPEMSEEERRKMVVKNFESVGMGLMETGMAWFWPDRRIARWTEVIGIEHIRDVQAQKRGILLVGIHFLTLELGARQFGMQEPGFSFTARTIIHSLTGYKGRVRSNKSILNRKDLKGMIKALKKGEVVWYTPIMIRPTLKRFRPVVCRWQAATTTGTWMLARSPAHVGALRSTP
ncbi:hypothetical protein ACNKHP_02675 [Shigella boydii]